MLLGFDMIWAAGGTPNAVFRLRPDDLLRLTGGTVADIAKPDRPGWAALSVLSGIYSYGRRWQLKWLPGGHSARASFSLVQNTMPGSAS